MKESPTYSPEFINRLKRGGYPLADILGDAGNCCLNEPPRAAARRTLRNWTEFSEEEISAAIFDEDRDQILPEILQAIGVLAQKWLANDLVPPEVTAKEVSRWTGFSPQKITRLVSEFSPTMDGFGQQYRLEIADNSRLPIKKAIKAARYESRPPGGGPVQRARFQKRRLAAQLTRLGQERTKIEFVPAGFQAEFTKNDADRIPNLRKAKELVIDSDVAEVIRYLKEKGGKNWLKGTTEMEFAGTLRELSGGKETDVLIWNCFDFDWIPAKKPGGYPTCVIKNTIDTSIVNYHAKRVAEVLEYLALLGPINPIVLTPTNEAFCQEWNYFQPLSDRQRAVESVTANLSNLINANITSTPITVMRFDDYVKSRGVTNNPENLTKEGISLFRKKLQNDRKLAQDLVRNNQEYFEQFSIRVKEEGIEKFIANYFGVYAGEGIGFAVISKNGRQIILIDLEEGRVAKTTIEGAKKAVSDGIGMTFPIVSPVSSYEKLDYYQNKRQIIQSRESKIRK